MQDVSDKLLNQFVACLEQRMGPDIAAAPEAAAAEPASAAGATEAPAPMATPDPEAVVAEEPASDVSESAAASSDPRAPAAVPDPGAPAVAASAPPQQTPPTTPSRGSDDALDLGKTVLPVLAKTYWKHAVAVLAVIVVLIWLFAR
jgi:hypothetical protein